MPEIPALRSAGSVLILSIAWYIGLHLILSYPVSPAFMFDAADATEYRQVSQWILHGTETNGTIVRPYLYPLLIGIAHGIGGVTAIWIMQAMAWLLSILLVHHAVLVISRSKVLAWSAALLLLTNLSFFALTYHALTEVLTVLGLSTLSAHVLIRSQTFRSPKYHAINLVLLSLLSLLKPVFFPLIPIYLFVIAVVLIRWKIFDRRLILIPLALLPLIPQFGIMMHRHDHFGISRIGPHTLKYYLFARGYSEINGISMENAYNEIEEFTDTEVHHYMMERPTEFFQVYLNNMYENLFMSTIALAPEYDRREALLIMDRLNKLYCLLHLLFMLICPFAIISLLRTRRSSMAFAVAMIYGISTYLLLTSGISSWQGDRLILPAMAAWSILYPIVLFRLIPKNDLLFTAMRSLS